MSVTKSKSISTTNLLNSYNNNAIEFTSDAIPGGETIEKANINIGGYDFEITPINNVFKFNFREISGVLVNPNNFTDDILPILIAADETSHILDDTTNTYLSVLVTYTITFSDDTVDVLGETYKFLKSVEQLEQDHVGVITGTNGMYALTPFQELTNNTYNVTYFEGFPFDIAIYLKTPGTVTVLNQTNLLTYDFPMPNTINRFFFSDGRSTITIDDFLPLVDGLNELKLTIGADIIYINVNKISSEDGHYLKWLNQYGEWNYWKFNCYNERSRKTKDLGSYFNDFEDVADTLNPEIGIGKTSTDSLILLTEKVEANDQTVLNGLFESPKVYYFIGERLSQVNSKSWINTRVTNTKVTTVNWKKKTNSYKVKISLPSRYTIKL